MMRKYLVAVTITVAVLAGTTQGYSQHWLLGGNTGVSLLDGSAGFHIAPVAELLFNRNMAVGSEFSSIRTMGLRSSGIHISNTTLVFPDRNGNRTQALDLSLHSTYPTVPVLDFSSVVALISLSPTDCILAPM